MRAAVLGLLLLVASASGAVAAPTEAQRRIVVEGDDGWLFAAQDWTVPCHDRGSAARTGRRMGELATALHEGGRRAITVIAPDKSTIRSGNVVAGRVPDRECALRQKREVWESVQGLPDFLDLRRPLSSASSRTQTYWRKDSHWTPSGGGVYARELAARLSGPLPLPLTSRPAVFRQRGDLALVLQRPADERAEGQQLVNPRVTVTEVRRRTALAMQVRQTAAVPEPGGRVLPGRTVFLGDSFDDYAVSQLAPLFEEAVFVWLLTNDPLEPIVQELAAADAVVVQSVERYLPGSRALRGDVLLAVRGLPARDADVLPVSPTRSP